MAKVDILNDPNGQFNSYMIYCPGCKRYHAFDSRWNFNGNFEKPTFTPSMLVFQSRPERRCHSFITDGKIIFLSDCYHELAGKTVVLEDIE